MDTKKLGALQTRLAAVSLPAMPKDGTSAYYHTSPDTGDSQKELAAIATAARTLLSKAKLVRGAKHQEKLTKLAATLGAKDRWGQPERVEATALRTARTALTGLLKAMEAESRPVFIVHGHDLSLRDEVQAALIRFGIEGIVLSQEVTQGDTIIEKFDRIARTCGYAVVLFTPDDIGGVRVGKIAPTQAPRARQNVVLELGYFVALLGRKKVFVLTTGKGLEQPSDFHGVLYETYDKAGSWKRRLANELEGAGFYIDPAVLKKL